MDELERIAYHDIDPDLVIGLKSFMAMGIITWLLFPPMVWGV